MSVNHVVQSTTQARSIRYPATPAYITHTLTGSVHAYEITTIGRSSSRASDTTNFPSQGRRLEVIFAAFFCVFWVCVFFVLLASVVFCFSSFLSMHQIRPVRFAPSLRVDSPFFFWNYGGLCHPALLKIEASRHRTDTTFDTSLIDPLFHLPRPF